MMSTFGSAGRSSIPALLAAWSRRGSGPVAPRGECQHSNR